MREASVSERRACTSGTIQIGACRLCKNMGEDSAPRSAGSSSMYSALPRNGQRAGAGRYAERSRLPALTSGRVVLVYLVSP
eukprot:810168-Pleurochrysis_carterae.AAC.1